ncbi:LCP family protein [Streptomyces ochraceiscleroticus]|uniref:LCP family protein n=1 Tax=Streptomyces ochraceiscleroticus TaxID=47761 RepID=A0ABW1MVI4_9ACTN|nr:LCP family protein [Streptomyces ochraceiscleroticus]
MLVTVLVLLALALAVALFFWAGGQLRQMDALSAYPGRPAAGKGTNWLLVGSDSRRDLTHRQQQELHVGHEAVRNTDTVMLLHYGDSGPSLVSLPRDSYVAVPGHGKNKINAAYGLGGAKLLSRTVEQATGLRVDHYAEVDFLGLVRVVDALGGVRLCLDAPLKDEKSGADFPAGCSRMNGTQALAYVRARYSDPKGDLGRVQRQRALISAVSERMLGPGTLLNPFRTVPALDAALAALRVDGRTGVVDLTQMGLSMKQVAKGSGTATTVPVTGPGTAVAGAGDVLVWDAERARRLFRALRTDEPIPTSAEK